jgi:hypothetical protein
MTIQAQTDTRLLTRILDEGYGPGAWHGPDFKAALADVSAELAFWRPAPSRHNIAELALHHAYYVHQVTMRLTGMSTPFVRDGEDFFALSSESDMRWREVQDVVAGEYRELAAAITDVGSGKRTSPLADKEQLDNILGITCHAAYHAGQIQLLKVLARR